MAATVEHRSDGYQVMIGSPAQKRLLERLLRKMQKISRDRRKHSFEVWATDKDVRRLARLQPAHMKNCWCRPLQPRRGRKGKS